MARFVLLHSPLLGPLSWRTVADELRAAGHVAETPAWLRLSGLTEAFYEALAAAMAREIDAAGGPPPILVVHSGAGAMVPALAARLATPAVGVVFADAILPHPGRSWMETAPEGLRHHLRGGVQDGNLPSWDEWWPPGALERLVSDDALRAALVAELEPIPAAYFEEPAPEAPFEAPAAFLKLSDAYEDEARLAVRQGWPVVRLPLDHLAPLTRPGAVALALDGLAARLAS